jgi:hypothetical protein
VFFRNGDKVLAATVETSPTFRASAAPVLFEKRYGNGWDVEDGGKRFLMVKPPAVPMTAPQQINVVLNWFEELRRRVPAAGAP